MSCSTILIGWHCSFAMKTKSFLIKVASFMTACRFTVWPFVNIRSPQRFTGRYLWQIKIILDQLMLPKSNVINLRHSEALWVSYAWKTTPIHLLHWGSHKEEWFHNKKFYCTIQHIIFIDTKHKYFHLFLIPSSGSLGAVLNPMTSFVLVWGTFTLKVEPQADLKRTCLGWKLSPYGDPSQGRGNVERNLKR